MAELQAVAMGGVALAALEYPALCDCSSGLDPWSLIGGWRGLRQMHANATLLLALATQAQAWDQQSSVLALQRMREDLLHLRRALLLDVWERVIDRGGELSGIHAHRAAYAYYDMTELLLKLYRHSPSRLYTHLESALWPDLTDALEGV